METINTIGRRKASIARIYLRSGKGNITVNNKNITDFFPLKFHQNIITKPLKLTENEASFDIKVTVRGGGTSGQADAICLAVSRALIKVDPENHSVLKPEGLLTRDPRVIERKKPGLRKARKKTQFSKR